MEFQPLFDEAPRHIVALSGGKDSTAMALRLADIEPRQYEYICTPTGNELPEMIEHWLTLGRMLGAPIKPITAGRSLGGIIRQELVLPNHWMRWCTRRLKIEPFEAYVLRARPVVVYVGIRADESREGVAYEDHGGILRRYPLTEWGWGIGCVRGYLQQRGVTIPERTDCAACFFQTLYEWWKLWRDHPTVWSEAEEWERLTGHTLRSDQRDTWPAALAGLRQRFESGDIPKQFAKKERAVMCSVCAR